MCIKKKYPTKDEAELSLKIALFKYKDSEVKPKRVYFCTICKAYYLTSKSKKVQSKISRIKFLKDISEKEQKEIELREKYGFPLD